MTLFAAEVGVTMWILVAHDLLDYGSSLTLSRFSLSQTLIPTTETYSEHFFLTGYYDYEVEVCYAYGNTASGYNHLWVPSLVFDVILAILSLWTAVRYSRQHSRPPRLNKPQLVDILIQGNVIYFLGYVFSCPQCLGFNNRM